MRTGASSRSGQNANQSFGERTRRSLLLLAIGLIHLAAILWLATRPPMDRPRPPSTEAMIDIAPAGGAPAASRPAKPQPPRIILPTLPVVIETPEVPPPAAPAPAAPAPGGSRGADAPPGGCALPQAVEDGIEHDPAAMAELATLSPAARTKADAVMLWDTHWLDLGVAPGRAAYGAIRSVVERTIAAAPQACREAAAAGPRFIPVAEPARTTMVVIGSGVWHWADLIKVDECVADASVPCVAHDSAPPPPSN